MVRLWESIRSPCLAIYSPGTFTEDGEVESDATAMFLKSFMTEFRDRIARVLTGLPRSS
jgi:hypothetical protein